MGQPITIADTTVEGEVAAFHTDRGITGQDGAAFTAGDEAVESESFPGELASRLFASDDAITQVFVASNQVVAQRASGWDDGSLAASAEIVAAFFVYYV